MDSTVHFVQGVTITSRELGGGLGMSTHITVNSCSFGKEIEDEIILFSNDKIITSLNGKEVSHQDR